MRIDAKLQWNKIARVFRLDDKTRDRTWHRMSELGITPEDPVMVLLALAGHIDRAAAELPAAIESIPKRTDAAASKIAQRVLNTAIQGLRATQEKDAEKLGKKVASQATEHFKRFEHLRQLRVSMEIAGIAIAIALGCGLVAYTLGKATAPQVSAESAQFAERPDAPFWLALVQLNPALPGTINARCNPGGAGAFTDNGMRACQVPLWMERGAEPEHSLLEAAQLYVSPWLPGRSDLIPLAAGFFTALFGRKIIRRATQWRPLRWLFDL